MTIDALELGFIPPEDEALRAPVRQFLEETLAGVPADRRARSWMGFDAGFSRALARRGWVGLTLPREYGGGGRGPFARFVVSEELLAAGAPVSAHWIADRQSGPLILKYGTESQKKFYLPRISRAEAFFCIGMSEPGSGSDLASIRTRATRTANGWLLNGSKIWTTNAQHSHYMIALVRSSGEPQDRYKGLSQLIVDLSLPGVTVRPIQDMSGDAHFSEVFFDNVECPADALVGEEGNGWTQVNAELAFERSGPERFLSTFPLLTTLVDELARRGDRGSGTEIGKLIARLWTLRRMSLAIAVSLADGVAQEVPAALVKDLGTRFENEIVTAAQLLLDLEPDPGGEGLPRLLAEAVLQAPGFTIRGGTSEVLRSMVARGMGLR